MQPFGQLLSSRPLLWLLLVVVLSAATSYTVSRFSLPAPGQDHRETAAPSFHVWMHRNLDITPEQEARLAPFENEFNEKEVVLKTRIRSAGTVLAHALEEDSTGSPEFEQALLDTQAAQGELQRLTLQHFLDMKQHLSPAQAKKLLEWTHDSILHEHSH